MQVIQFKEDNEDDIFAKTAGIILSQNIDPIKWQNDIRLEYYLSLKQ